MEVVVGGMVWYGLCKGYWGLEQAMGLLWVLVSKLREDTVPFVPCWCQSLWICPRICDFLDIYPPFRHLGFTPN
jgi:hypothetical protein